MQNNPSGGCAVGGRQIAWGEVRAGSGRPVTGSASRSGKSERRKRCRMARHSGHVRRGLGWSFIAGEAGRTDSATDAGQRCARCQRPLHTLRWNSKGLMLVCENIACSKYHNPQGLVRGGEG